ncbi:hypothetical protein BXY41_11635 [Lacrimispora xylanisolvens]|uniref:Uncharacterized protein n=1 Tax=Lacrimispora xylanisolvens TaxID=384636 RepID=A0A2S6HJ64_9FIRM|nr:hypothetical protein [Hungatella xylanolytica]PPK77497.1 hypothetical protein BXY41_11635 [Hungatella xylanolytica]
MKKIITYTEEQVLQMKYMLNAVTTTGIQNAKQVATIAQVIDSGMPGEIIEPEKPEKLKGLYSAADWVNPPEQKTKISNKPEKKEGEG